MRDAVGGSLLLNIVVMFTSIVILFFAGIMAYSKAYKIKNRIIEVVEKYETYDPIVQATLDEELRKAGYIVATANQVEDKCEDGNLNTSEYLYCIYKECKICDDSSKCVVGECVEENRHYVVETFIHFNFPVIGNMLTFKVKGETKILGKNYNY